MEIIGICAFNEERLYQTAKKYKIPLKNIYISKTRFDYQKMLIKLQPDGVYVIGQPEYMFDIWIWCLSNKFNLFIEKPMGITIQQTRMLAYLARENKCITQVSHQRRSAPILQKMKDECMKRGPLTNAIVEFYKYDIRPMFEARDRMLDDFTHSVDTARWICGGEVVKGEKYDTKEIAGSSELFVYGGFQNKSIEFVSSLLEGKEKTSSPFSDVLKTMEICDTILGQAMIGFC